MSGSICLIWAFAIRMVAFLALVLSNGVHLLSSGACMRPGLSVSDERRSAGVSGCVRLEEHHNQS